MTESSPPLETFRRQFTDPATVALDVSAACIAAHLQQGATEIDAMMSGLDDLAAQVPEPTLDGVLRLLFRDLGFRGDDTSYYDPANSYLDAVLERRRGIPISLAVVTIEVGRRVGVPLFGVGMPGHFLVGDRVDDTLFIDVFRGGARLTVDQARQVFETMQPAGARFSIELLRETPPADIVLRMLNNLRMVHARAQRPAALIRTLELMVCLPSCPPDEVRNLASALDQLGRIDEATRHLERLLERLDGTDAEAVEGAITRMWAKLN